MPHAMTATLKPYRIGLNEGRTFGRSLSGYMRLNAACQRATLEKAMAQLKSPVYGL